MEKTYIYDQKIIERKLKELIGLPLNGIRGSFGTLFLEIGDELYEEEYASKKKTPRCVHSFMIDPNRRFQKKGKMIFSCDSVDRRVFHKVMKKLFGLKIIDIKIVAISGIHELYIKLEGNIEFYTFTTMDHNPYGGRTGFLDNISYVDQKSITRKESKYQIGCNAGKHNNKPKLGKVYLVEKVSFNP